MLRPFGAVLVVTAPPNRCPPPVRGAVIVDLAPDDLAVRFFHDGGTYWEQLERVFAREGLCALPRGGLMRSCFCLGMAPKVRLGLV